MDTYWRYWDAITIRWSHCIDFTRELSIHYNLSMAASKNAQPMLLNYKIRFLFLLYVFVSVFSIRTSCFSSFFFFRSVSYHFYLKLLDDTLGNGSFFSLHGCRRSSKACVEMQPHWPPDMFTIHKNIVEQRQFTNGTNKFCKSIKLKLALYRFQFPNASRLHVNINVVIFCLILCADSLFRCCSSTKWWCCRCWCSFNC